MAISTLDGLIAASKQPLRILKTSAISTATAMPFTTIDSPGVPGAGSLSIGNTTSGVVPTSATAGFPSIRPFGVGETGYLHSVEYGCTTAGRFTLYDRLFHVGSVSLTTLATTTLSGQPVYDARLPGENYDGLEMFIEINAAVSATATTVAVSYTNESGTTGQSTGASASLSGYVTRRMVQLPLQAGDRGVQKIESITVGGTVASTGSANVVVARRLWSGRIPVANAGGLDDFGSTGLPRVYDSSALWLVIESDTSTSGIPEVVATIASG